MTKQDKPMPPDQRLRVVAQLRKFMAANKSYTLGDIYHETGVPVSTTYSWMVQNRKPYPGANIEALDAFLKGRGYHG